MASSVLARRRYLRAYAYMYALIDTAHNDLTDSASRKLHDFNYLISALYTVGKRLSVNPKEDYNS